jgi:hypothetical protein
MEPIRVQHQTEAHLDNMMGQPTILLLPYEKLQTIKTFDAKATQGIVPPSLEVMRKTFQWNVGLLSWPQVPH